MNDASGHTSAVSLHAHTNRSREAMTMVPQYLSRIPVVAAMARREMRSYEQRHGAPADFTKAWWRPPVTPEQVLASEVAQITGLGMQPLVSITDHDSIEAGVMLRLQRHADDIPLSFEWTVPFDTGFFHLGVHNLPAATDASVFAALNAFTRSPLESRLHELLAYIDDASETLVVLNHPMWDLAGVGVDHHRALLRDFAQRYGAHVHAVELNGYRTWSENRLALEFADQYELPIVSGGDRHGRSPNAMLNLTRASSFAEFVSEVRDDGRSVILTMPEYWQSLVSRKLVSAADALRTYSTHEAGHNYWTHRVSYESDGEERRLSLNWPTGGPWWVRTAVHLFELATSDELLAATELCVRLAGASMSEPHEPGVAVTRAASWQEIL